MNIFCVLTWNTKTICCFAFRIWILGILPFAHEGLSGVPRLLSLTQTSPTQEQREPSENVSTRVTTAHSYNKTGNWKWDMFREKNQLKHSVCRQMMLCLPGTLHNLPLTHEEGSILLEIVRCFQDSSAESWCQMLWPLPQTINSLAELSEGSRWWAYLQGKNRRQPISSSHMWPPSLLKSWTIYISISLYTRKRCSVCC